MTKHVSEDDLVLHHYRETSDEETARIDAHLGACETCRTAHEELRRVLAAVSAAELPERGDDYARAVWARLQPQLRQAAPRAKVLAFPRRIAPWAALAASLAVAFALGRASHEREVRLASAPISAPARERILLVAVGEHLERSQMVLVELVNAQDGAAVDISSERQWAQELVPANRLYRQAAQRAGESGVASVLDDLERVLVEVANSPDQLSPAAFEEIRGRIEAQGILFKVRVIGSQVREREKEQTRPALTKTVS